MRAKAVVKRVLEVALFKIAVAATNGLAWLKNWSTEATGGTVSEVRRELLMYGDLRDLKRELSIYGSSRDIK